MASELGLIYSSGRHWTGSMIELNYGTREPSFQLAHNCYSTMDDTNLPDVFSKRATVQHIKTQENVFQRLLEATRSQDRTDVASGDIFRNPVARYLLEILREKSGLRHSITSLLPTENSSSDVVTANIPRRSLRCRSSEPQASGSRRSGSVSPERKCTMFSCFERLSCVFGGRSALPIPPSRKRLSLSDSEICYRKNADDQGADTTVQEKSAESGHPQESSSTFFCQDDDEDAVEPKEDGSIKTEPEPESIPTNSELAFQTQQEMVPEEEVKEAKKKKKKSVRFADSLGMDLTEERLIEDTALPPLLSRRRLDSFEDDFRDLGDLENSLPGVTRPTLPLFGKRAGSSPDIIRLPPPVPTLPHSCSSTGPLTSPTLLGSTLSGSQSPSSPSLTGCAWRLTFAQPAAQYLAFRQRLESKFVSLENVSVSQCRDDAKVVSLYGTVKVKNIAFEKHVKLRVTSDKWASHKDFPATHNVQLSNGASSYDTFMFNFTVKYDGSDLSRREIQFAVCFIAGEGGSAGEHWDNNDGCNYVVSETTSQEEVFRRHPSVGRQGTMMGESLSDGPPAHHSHHPYTLDYRPNFDSFASLTSYSSWQHYSSESMYY